MRGERQRTDFDVLRDCWGRWTEILSLFARRRPARCRLDPCAYAALHKELIAACRSLAEADDPERAFYASLEETIKPWLNLRALERTDREILTGLALHCREVERKLSGRKWRLAWPRQGGPAMAIVAGGAVLGGFLWLLLPVASLSVLITLRDAIDLAWLTIKFADNWQKACVSAVMVVVAAMYIVSRSAKA
jgi:hypothetical protein